jgi:PRTRC genetic system protein E
MFTSIASMLTQKDLKGITLTIAQGSGDNLIVIVTPNAKDAKDGVAAACQPLQLTGTAAELEEGFVEAVTSFSSERQSLLEQVEDTNLVLQAAKKESADKAKNAVKKGGASARLPAPAATTTPSGDDDDDDGEDGNSTAPPATAAAPVTAAKAPLNLFDEA